MKTLRTLRLIVLPSILALAAASALSADPPKPQDLIARKSIFSRDRSNRNASTRPAATAPAPPPSPVLTGIIREDTGGFVAVLETPGSGRPVFLHTGDALPGNRGTITEMNLDCFVFVPASGAGGEAPRKAFVGRNLDGSEATLVPSATGPSDAPIEGDDVISRMRRRRQQEGK